MMPGTAVAACLYALDRTGARRATKYLGEKFRVTVSRQFRPSKRNTRETFVVTVGAPNYADRLFIRTCAKSGEPLPVKRVQLKFFPAKKRKL